MFQGFALANQLTILMRKLSNMIKETNDIIFIDKDIGKYRSNHSIVVIVVVFI